jgi:hypothetical protein
MPDDVLGSPHGQAATRDPEPPVEPRHSPAQHHGAAHSGRSTMVGPRVAIQHAERHHHGRVTTLLNMTTLLKERAWACEQQSPEASTPRLGRRRMPAGRDTDPRTTVQQSHATNTTSRPCRGAEARLVPVRRPPAPRVPLAGSRDRTARDGLASACLPTATLPTAPHHAATAARHPRRNLIDKTFRSL